MTINIMNKIEMKKMRVGTVTHGLRSGGKRTKEYSAWDHMIRRCRTVSSKNYKNYGGRGITVCDRWTDFVSFLADVGEAPSSKHSLDRIDNNGNYEPGNVKWSTHREQQRNRTNNRFMTHNGRTASVAQWAEEIKMNYHTLINRVKTGWSDEEALTTPTARKAQ